MPSNEFGCHTNLKIALLCWSSVLQGPRWIPLAKQTDFAGLRDKADGLLKTTFAQWFAHKMQLIFLDAFPSDMMLNVHERGRIHVLGILYAICQFSLTNTSLAVAVALMVDRVWSLVGHVLKGTHLLSRWGRGARASFVSHIGAEAVVEDCVNEGNSQSGKKRARYCPRNLNASSSCPGLDNMTGKQRLRHIPQRSWKVVVLVRQLSVSNTRRIPCCSNLNSTNG